MKQIFKKTALAALIGYAGSAMAITFETENVSGSFDSTLTLGMGKRMQKQSCSLVGDITGNCGTSADYATWSNGDDGNLNYNKGDFFTTYVKGNHELLLKLPADVTFMARANWMYDWAADDTRRTSLLSEGNGDGLKQMTADVNLMDFWVSKGFNIGEQRARVRIGQQAINWGESLFAPGGINATNALDINRLSSPGAQLKEVVLPAPMISFASSVVSGVNVEAYYQWGWKPNKMPAAGSYWSVADLGGRGSSRLLALDVGGGAGGLPLLNGIDAATYARMNGISLDAAKQALAFNVPGGTGAQDATALGVPQALDQEAKNSGQYGFSLRWKPSGLDTDFGFYFINYHDKNPNLRYWVDAGNGNSTGGQTQNVFLEDRKMYGVSANTTLGNWAVGAELSYRPKDAVALSACSDPTVTGAQTASNFLPGFFADQNANCDGWMDTKKYQMHLTGILSLTPGDHGAVLNFLGADTGTFLGELIWTRYPDINPNDVISRSVTGADGSVRTWQQVIAAGAYTWPGDSSKTNLRGTGSRDSVGYMFDFSLVYDGSIIPGWQVIPGVFVQHALKGETPNFVGFWLEGAKSANFYVNFVQNPSNWQAGVNYTTFWGGKSEYHQILKDRDFIGAYVSRNF